jgi:peptidoglycan/LPS O-acetylase OafA/YrhL
MRFFAAMLVVGFHCSLGFKTPFWAGDLLRNGYEAVSFFFVLSGFILTYVYAPEAGSSISKGRFWAARIARICPVYYLALALDLPRVVYSANVVHTTEKPLFLAALFATPLFLQSWIPSVESIWNLPAWSLSVEAFFYAIFPFLIPPLLRVRTGRVIAGALLLVFVVGGLRSVINTVCTPELCGVWTTVAHYQPLLHLPHFILGSATAMLILQGKFVRPGRAECIAAGTCICIVSIFWGRSHLPAMMVSDAILAPLYALLIYSAAQSKGIFSSALSRNVFVGLGEISYGIYILHGPLFFIWARLCERKLHISPVSAAWTFIPLLIISCTLVYILIEKPCRRIIALHFNRRLRPS